MKTALRVCVFMGFAMFIACDKENNRNNDGRWHEKILTVNEGPFQSGTGTISAYDRVTGDVTQDIFQIVNGRPLGNIVQSITVSGNRAYIVVNNANRVEVVDKSSFETEGSIEGVTLPVYFLVLDEMKGYVSCMDSTVKVIDMKTLTVGASIPVGPGPDRMLLTGADLWVLNGGGFASDSTVSIIDTETDGVRRTLVPGDVPCGIVTDADGMVWILCSGRGWNGFPGPSDTPGRLVCYDPADFSVKKMIPFPSADLHPDNLVVNPAGDVLYINHPQGIYALGITENELPAGPLVQRSRMLYGIGYDPSTDRLMGADAMDYVQNGWAYFYDPADGTPLDSFPAGVIPNGFWTGE